MLVLTTVAPRGSRVPSYGRNALKIGHIGALALAASIGLGGCTDGYGYGGVGVGYASDPYYGGGAGDYYGAGDGGFGSYYGWYGDYYYPGSGVYVFDRNRRAYRWNGGQQRYWQSRQHYRGGTVGNGRDGNWVGFDRGGRNGVRGNGVPGNYHAERDRRHGVRGRDLPSAGQQAGSDTRGQFDGRRPDDAGHDRGGQRRSFEGGQPTTRGTYGGNRSNTTNQGYRGGGWRSGSGSGRSGRGHAPQ